METTTAYILPVAPEAQTADDNTEVFPSYRELRELSGDTPTEVIDSDFHAVDLPSFSGRVLEPGFDSATEYTDPDKALVHASTHFNFEPLAVTDPLENTIAVHMPAYAKCTRYAGTTLLTHTQ